MFELTPFDRRNHRFGDSMNPFGALENFEREFFGRNIFGEFKADIRDEGKNYVLEADLPGFSKEDIHVDVDNGMLTISAERNSETEQKGENGYVRRERSYGSYSRSFDISNVNTDDIKGNYANGVLTLTLPKKYETAPGAKRIELE